MPPLPTRSSKRKAAANKKNQATPSKKKANVSDESVDLGAQIAAMQKQLVLLQKQQNVAGDGGEEEQEATDSAGEEAKPAAESAKAVVTPTIIRRLTKEEAATMRNKEMSKLVRGCTKTHIWRTQKFVKSEEHLDKLTKAVMDILDVVWTSLKGLKEGTYEYQQAMIRRENFVATYRDDVRKEINEKRSYTMVSL
jgi:hypothetical protein